MHVVQSLGVWVEDGTGMGHGTRTTQNGTRICMHGTTFENVFRRRTCTHLYTDGTRFAMIISPPSASRATRRAGRSLRLF